MTAGQTQTLFAFRATFGTMGLLTVASAWILWQLAPDTPTAMRAEHPADVA